MKKLLSAIAAAILCVSAQTQQPGTGAYPHVTLDNRGFDAVNVGNMNVRFTIPIFSKQGRGVPFNYTIQYEGLIWKPTTSGSVTTWSNDPSWGFLGQVNGVTLTGYLTSQLASITCPVSNGHTTTVNGTNNYVYHDPYGGVHPSTYQQAPHCGDSNGIGIGVTPSGGASTDGSGYIVTSPTSVVTKLGATIAPLTSATGSSASSWTDSNGNYISNGGSGTFVDTTGKTALTVSGSNPVTYTYPVVNQANSATTASASLTYAAYKVRTHFQCSGVGDVGASSPLSASLVDHITLADGSTYKFTYEATPSFSDGSVTGRLASVTLPTGGTISYSYSGGSNGIVCSDGTVPVLTRVTSDGTRSYQRPAPGLGINTTMLQDERGKQSYYWFSIDSQGRYEQTHRRAHDGTASNTNLLEEDITCYNNQAQSNGTCDGQAISYPISEVDTSTNLNYVSNTATTKNSYDSSGNLTQTSVYGNGTLLSRTVNAYTKPNQTTELTSTTIYDGSSNVAAYTGYGYDSSPVSTPSVPNHNAQSSSPGNVTAVVVSIDGSTSNTLSTQINRFNTGVVQASVAPGNPSGSSSCGSGTISCYGYDSTGTFLSSTVLPTPSSGVGMSTSAAYDVTSGAMASVTGLNANQTFTTTQYDSLLRATNVTTPEGGTISAVYTPNQVSAKQQMNSSQSKDTETYLDTYGRTRRVSVQSSSGWYVTDTCYDAAGNVQYQSTPYLNSSSNPSSNNCSTSTATQYTYDGLNRVLKVAMPDGHVTSTSYNGRAVQTADSNGQTKTLQYDQLGRLAGVCEIVPAQTWDGGDTTQACGSGSVAFDITGNGFTTAYTYNLAAHTVAVSQGAQTTRSFQTDAAGRLTRVVEPESGVTTYSYAYNATGLQVARTRPRANQTNASVTTTTTTQYDTLGRVLDITYNDGTPQKHFVYDQGLSGGLVPNAGPGAKGQLTGTATIASNNTVINAGGLAYDIMGRVIQNSDCLTGWCANSALNVNRSYGYDLASQLTYEGYNTLQNNGGVFSVSYAYNTAGQLTLLKNGQNNAVGAPTIYSATSSSMQPGGPQFITYGNNVTAYLAYDVMDRTSGQWVCGLPGGLNCPNGSHYFYGYGFVMSGSKLTNETDTVNGDWSQYNYDFVGNLSNAQNWNGNASNGFAAGYDRYGNRWNEQVTKTANGSGPNQTLSFNTTNNQVNSAGFVYDAAGNLRSDGAHVYSYDAENSLITVDQGSSSGITQYYTALNHRDAVTNGAGTFRFGFDAQGRRVTQWDNNSGNANQTQYYAEGKNVAFWNLGDNNIHFEHQDWLGTERMRTDLNGSTTVSSFSSLPFGEPNLLTGSDQSSNHFTSLDQDSAFSPSSLGLHHAMFREYSSILGRWMSPDPYMGSYDLTNPQSFNRYSYVQNSPLSNTDPDGRSCITVHQVSVDGNDVGDTYADDGDGQGCAGAGIGPGFGPGTDDNPGPGTDVNCPDCYSNAPSATDSPSSGFLEGSAGMTGGPIGAFAPNNGQVPVHGPWTYGHFCGAGGMGTPINGTDAACQAHDQCYAQAGFSPGSNYQGANAQLQACNQQLCNAVRASNTSLLQQGDARVIHTSRGSSPQGGFTPAQAAQFQANSDINLFFTWLVAPGNSCHLP